MIVVVITPRICPKCQKYTIPGQRVDRIYQDFDKDIYQDYHVECLREPIKESKDNNQEEIFNESI